MDLKVSQEVPVSIVAEDRFGNPTGACDAPPSWSVSDPSLGAATVAADGMSAVFIPSGKIGACQLQVSGIAQGHSIAGALDLNLLAGVIQPGAPVDQ